MRQGIAALAAGTAVLLAGCSGGAGPMAATGGPPVVDGTFRTTIAADPGNLDPQMTALNLTRWVTSFLYDSLISVDEKGKAQSYLAKSWKITPNSVTYTLNAGITCSDGTALTASDVAANIGFVANPASKSPQLGLWVQAGVTTKADDAARTVTVTSPTPDPFLLYGTGSLQIVCKKGLTNRSSLAKSPVGTGMYTLTESVAGDHYSFQRRAGYQWGPGGAKASDPGAPKTVRVGVVAAQATAANMFQVKDLDAVQVTGPDADRLRGGGARSYDVRSPGSSLYFNQVPSRPGADPAVRKALAAGTDVTAVGKVMSGGRGLAPKDLGGSDPRICTGDSVTGSLPAFNAAAAKKALDAAGWKGAGVRTKAGKPLKMNLFYLSEMGAELISAAELLATQWRALGVDVKLRPFTQLQANEILFNGGDWDAILMRLTTLFPSQLTPFVSGPAGPTGTNFANIKNAAYAAAVTKAKAMPMPGGCAQWDEAARALMKAVDVVPIVDTVNPIFVQGASFEFNGGTISPPTIRMFGP